MSPDFAVMCKLVSFLHNLHALSCDTCTGPQCGWPRGPSGRYQSVSWAREWEPSWLLEGWKSALMSDHPATPLHSIPSRMSPLYVKMNCKSWRGWSKWSMVSGMCMSLCCVGCFPRTRVLSHCAQLLFLNSGRSESENYQKDHTVVIFRIGNWKAWVFELSKIENLVHFAHFIKASLFCANWSTNCHHGHG